MTTPNHQYRINPNEGVDKRRTIQTKYYTDANGTRHEVPDGYKVVRKFRHPYPCIAGQ
jgi:hypothetical protein